MSGESCCTNALVRHAHEESTRVHVDVSVQFLKAREGMLACSTLVSHTYLIQRTFLCMFAFRARVFSSCACGACPRWAGCMCARGHIHANRTCPFTDVDICCMPIRSSMCVGMESLVCLCENRCRCVFTIAPACVCTCACPLVGFASIFETVHACTNNGRPFSFMY